MKTIARTLLFFTFAVLLLGGGADARVLGSWEATGNATDGSGYTTPTSLAIQAVTSSGSRCVLQGTQAFGSINYRLSNIAVARNVLTANLADETGNTGWLRCTLAGSDYRNCRLHLPGNVWTQSLGPGLRAGWISNWYAHCQRRRR
jgi:hypothetical protein